MLSIIFLVLFLILMIIIGIWGMKKTSTLNDFFLGNRSVGPWISAIAYGTTYFSAVLFIGFAGKLGWGLGLNALWISLGNTLIGSLLAWLILAKRTRTMTQNLNSMTMPEFLEARYHSRLLKIFSAILIFVFLLPYSASVFKGLGHLFEANFKINYDIALLIMILITGIYMVLGGYFAITLNDFIQGIIMIIGAILMVIILVGKAGGLTESVSTIIKEYNNHIPIEKQPNFLTILCFVLMTSFGPWGLPQMVQKFYAIKNESVIKKAAIITTIFAFIVVFSAYWTGAMTHIFYTPSSLPLTENGTVNYDALIPNLLKNNLPDFLMAIILLLILSASMSTLSSLVLVSSSSVAIDLYKGHINPNISKKNSLAMMRFLSAIFIVISYFIARFKIGIIVTLMSLSWGAVAGSLMAPYIYGLFWKRVTKEGAFAGMITGLLLSVSLFFIMGEKNSSISSVIAMAFPFIVVPVVSLLTKPPKKEIIDIAFKE
ncbi:MAG TPA: sodium/solute symporter [Spirochaetota bacterium]|nr:sodium/solute symporter [Spirochaetota bacterium]HOL57596.1 sodium/solute symporter [Spirochaetota bacterium]HPP05093.1 sodium/solute symporter [Spirochaetota bacterium]